MFADILSSVISGGTGDLYYLGSMIVRPRVGFLLLFELARVSGASQRTKESLRSFQMDVSCREDSAHTGIAPSHCRRLSGDLGSYRCSRFGHVSRDCP